MKLTEQLKKPTWIAAIFAFFTGIAAHLFGLVNILHNHDNITRSWGYGDGISSGRWFLHLVGEAVSAIGGNVNLPLVCGIIFIAFLAVSAALFVSVLGVKGRKSAAIIGAVFVTFPAVTSTLFYRYTAGYYGLAIFLAVLAVWVIDMNKYVFLRINDKFKMFFKGNYDAFLELYYRREESVFYKEQFKFFLVKNNVKEIMSYLIKTIGIRDELKVCKNKITLANRYLENKESVEIHDNYLLLTSSLEESVIRRYLLDYSSEFIIIDLNNSKIGRFALVN